MKLIYHKIKNTSNESIFDKSFVEHIKNQDISFVCPYIGLEYFQELISIVKSWTLITDIEEWIYSCPKQKNEIADFITANTERIRHISLLHAKVILSKKGAIIGSANLTKSGVCKRTEMSILISDKTEVKEIKEWQYDLWKSGIIPNMNSIKSFIAKNHFEIKPNKISTFESGISINTSLIIRENPSEENILINCLRKAKKSKEWMQRYFDLIKDVILDFSISDDSPKINMCITNRYEMPITIGQRYIINPSLTSDKIGIIVPLEYENLIDDKNNIEKGDYFYKKNQKGAFWVKVNSDYLFDDADELKEFWKMSIAKELERTKKSGFKKSHNKAYYKAVVDIKYRDNILDKV